jgi:hypothetical protein
MTYPNSQPQLGSLDFETIKSNLTSYLRQQSIIKDYAYEGSVMQTLVNLLAYNTFYYAYYSNMIASEMFLDSAQRIDSVVSLVKPLGYTVPGPTSSRAKLRLTGVTDTVIGKHQSFSGTTIDGVNYIFYTLNDYNVDADGAVTIDVYEGKELVYLDNSGNGFDVDTIVNLDQQKYFILDNTIDLSTLVVEVKRAGETIFYEWKLSSNIGSPFDIDQKIYFVERLSDGFAIQFGKENKLGLSLQSGDKIKIRYLTSSGASSNTINIFNLVQPANFSYGNLVINLIETSSGGLNEPSLDMVKFLAPKLFSAQGRAVTKNDIKAILLEAQKVQSLDDFNVFGGEELFPPRFGRVFVSMRPGTTQTTIQNILDFLKERCVITILPEYVEPKQSNVFIRYTANYQNQYSNSREKENKLEQLKTYVDTNFLNRNVFNASVDAEQIKNSVESNIDNVQINLSSFEIFFREVKVPEDGQYSYNFGNEIQVNLIDNYAITNTFVFKDGSVGTLRIQVNQSSPRNTFIPLKAYDTNNLELSGDFGRVNIKNGTIEINDIAQTAYVLTIPFKNKYFTANLNNIINFYQTEVSFV